MHVEPEVPSTAEETAADFVRVWAEAVIRQARRSRESSRRRMANERMYDRNDGPALMGQINEETLREDWRTAWAEEHTLIWMVHQLERWQARLAKERGQEAPPENAQLKLARNVLEHLDDLELDEVWATVPDGLAPKRAKRMAISSFPDRRISLDRPIQAEVLDPEGVTEEALKVVAAVDELLDDQVRAYLVDLQRGR
ncbi:hypothetical protein ACFWR6_06995 [Streptomyces griseus]|uniref:hypothetical protein n=1 Tax=Streptomyces griseus TaxID=1911 RepID=UPI00366000CB